MRPDPNRDRHSQKREKIVDLGVVMILQDQSTPSATRRDRPQSVNQTKKSESKICVFLCSFVHEFLHGILGYHIVLYK